jgi:dolichol-phosphate mannosyltransferase
MKDLDSFRPETSAGRVLHEARSPLTVPSLSEPKQALWFSLVIPTYDECANLPVLLAQITEVLSAKYADRYEIIVVDDNSPDGTADQARLLTNQYFQLTVLCRKKERGLASAVVRGWQVASGVVLGVIDADMQHPPGVLANLLAAIETGADLAVASRYVDLGSTGNWGFLRRTLSAGAGMLAAVFLPEVFRSLKDPLSGCFVVLRTAVEGVPLEHNGYKILLEVLVRGRAKHPVEVPFSLALRHSGRSKVSFKQGWQYILQLMALRWFLFKKMWRQ